jgi:hypothetical protein
LRTDKLKALCPEILRVMLPVIDPLVEEYDRGDDYNDRINVNAYCR